jgi:hypothetical protein
MLVRYKQEAIASLPYLMAIICLACPLSVMGYQQITVSASLERPIASLGEPILLDLRITNIAQSDVELDLGDDSEGNVDISVKDPSGKAKKKSDVGQREGITFFGKYTLLPQATQSQVLVLNKWFSFDTPGVYSIKVELLGINDMNGAIDLDLHITDADDKEMTILCSELGKRLHSSSAGEALTAATALSYVHNPVVVPIWQSVIKVPPLERSAVLGLSQIGDRNAVAVLIQALDDSDSETHQLIISVLRAIAGKTTDRAIRANINAVLAGR